MDMRYEVRLIADGAGLFDAPEIVPCGSRDEAIACARRMAADPIWGSVEAWQLGAAGGDPATTTGLLWSGALAEIGLAEPDITHAALDEILTRVGFLSRRALARETGYPETCDWVLKRRPVPADVFGWAGSLASWVERHPPPRRAA